MTEQQLADARQRLADMEDLLRDLPEIFERKFQQRLQPLVERHDRLLEDNQQLRQQMRQLTATNAEMRQLPPAAEPLSEPATAPTASTAESTPAATSEPPIAQTPQPAPPSVVASSGLRLPSLPDKPPKRWSFLGNPSGNGRAA
jgi:hypothetical protein